MQINYEVLNKVISQYLPPNDCESIHKSYLYAQNAHQKQTRKSGEPYIVHPLSVALILAEQKMPATVIIAGLLHDVVEDTEIDNEEIKELFGEEICSIVDGVTKLDKMANLDVEDMAAENQRKVIVASAKDVRVIIVKLADRLHNMQTIKYMNESKQKKIAKETLEVYAPIAHRLGMYKIKWELEDLSFKVLNKNAYDDIAKKISMKRSVRDEFVDEVIEEVKGLLEQHKIKARVYGRTKHIYSIYQTMKKKHKAFEEINDLFGFRIVVDDLNDCYRALGIIHNYYKPIPLSFKDYIPTPKHNLYQSIHTTVLRGVGEEQTRIEFQIRTEDMDKVAENGVAAHWAYKERDEEQNDKLVEQQLRNFKDAVEALQERRSDKFVRGLQDDFFAKTIIVYTPKGDVIELPEKSCALDFAFYVHTDIGLHAVNAIVNDKVVSIFYPLEMGDIVNIITSDVAEPDVSYLSKVTTHRAKDKLNKYFSDVERQEIQLQGSRLLTDLGHELGIKELTKKNNEDYLLSLAVNFDVYEVEDFLYELGSGDIKLKDVRSILTKTDINDDLPEVIVDDERDFEVKICRRCNPIPGDRIQACVFSLNKFMIHREHCKYLTTESSEAHWSKKAEGELYDVVLKLIIKDENNALSSVLNDVSATGLWLSKVQFVSKYEEESEGLIAVAVHNKDQYEELKDRLKENKYILQVNRELYEND